jgi:sulfur relay (sulfurtransferase) DsrF/TusC family protein
MPNKILSIVESAYRGTIEEQDDTIVWLMHTLRGAGADIDILLRGNAVNYTVKGQDAAGLVFGERRQTQPPTLDNDLMKLITQGARIMAVDEDLTERGIERAEMIAGVTTLRRDELARLLDSYDNVWHW